MASTLQLILFALLIAWQPAWHLWLSPSQLFNPIAFTVLAILPLLLPFTGMLRNRPKAAIWGAYLALFYFVYAVMEAWADPAARLPAWVQILLVLAYLSVIVIDGRRRKKQA